MALVEHLRGMTDEFGKIISQDRAFDLVSEAIDGEMTKSALVKAYQRRDAKMKQAIEKVRPIFRDMDISDPKLLTATFKEYFQKTGGRG